MQLFDSFIRRCGRLMRKRHPEVVVKGKRLDFSDIMNDPLIKWQKEYVCNEQRTLAFGSCSTWPQPSAHFFLAFSFRSGSNYWTLYFLFGFFIPTAVPCLLWNETLFRSIIVTYVARTVFTFNITMLINSAAHKFGDRPYNASISPTDNSAVAFVTMVMNVFAEKITASWQFCLIIFRQSNTFTPTHGLTGWQGEGGHNFHHV